MMVSTFLERAGSSVADVVVAAAAALAVVFFAWAMPDAVFANLVGATGLAGALPGGEPPFGATARLLAALAASILAFILVVLVLRALNGQAATPRWSFAPTLDQDATPRFRRADAHPDAPARAPVFAARELGDPDAEELLLDSPEAHVPETDAVLEASMIWPSAAEADYEPPVEAETGHNRDEPFELEAEFLEADQQAETDETPFWTAVTQNDPQSSEPAPEAPIEVAGSSIAQLMRRLEAGLAVRADRGDADVPATAVMADDRLRQAVEGLQRLAGRAS